MVFHFSTLSLEIEGSHLSKKVRETISVTDQCMPSLFLFMALSCDEKAVLKKPVYLTLGGDIFGRRNKFSVSNLDCSMDFEVLEGWKKLVETCRIHVHHSWYL